MTSNTDSASTTLTAVRAALADFDWETDDRQYALEEIERIVSADDHTYDRAAFINGLRSLADFLESSPDVPVPGNFPGSVTLTVFPDGDTDDEQRAGVDSIATALGVSTDEHGTHRHYVANLDFGPVQYKAVAIPTTPVTSDCGGAVVDHPAVAA